MQFMLWILTFILSSVPIGFSEAQIGASAGLSTPGNDHPEEALESGRYQVKPGVPIEVVKAKPQVEKKKRTRKVSSEPAKAETQPAANPTTKVETTTEVTQPPPSYADQLKGLVTGENQPIEAYKEQVHPDDIRLNKIEINVVPGLLSTESKSSYSFRNYVAYSPFAAVGAEIWWTPLIGIYGSYGTSVGADIVDNGALQSRTRVNQELIEAGIDFRKFFGLSRKSNSITFGVQYFEFKFSPPGDNSNRTKTKSAGLGIHFQARFPIAPSYAWTIGAKMEPRISHSESGTALGLQSGANPESSRMTLLFGGEFKLSREHQLIWSLSASVEKNQFSGSANMPDPDTGVTPQGVSVTQTLSLLSFGYRWGH